MSTGAAITQFHMEYPAVRIPQQQTHQWAAAAHSRAESIHAGLPQPDAAIDFRMERLFAHYGVNSALIAARHFDTLDTTQTDSPRPNYCACDAAEGMDIGARTTFFVERANAIFQRFYAESVTPPGHIVHVTCTGYASPSAPQRLVATKGWAGQTDVTHAYHMGCYAALPAIRMAEGFVAVMENKRGATRPATVDIVHNEICSLHMNPLIHAPEQIVVQTLFADGHIKYSVVPRRLAASGFFIANIHEQVLPESEADMTWVPSHWGMKMTLSREVPDKIAKHLRAFLQTLLEPTGHALAETLSQATFAIHPGGPRIIDAAQQTLGLRDAQLAASRHVLSSRGNMSSATLPHVWKEVLDRGVDKGGVVVSLAFGPGLTMFGSVFEAI